MQSSCCCTWEIFPQTDQSSIINQRIPTLHGLIENSKTTRSHGSFMAKMRTSSMQHDQNLIPVWNNKIESLEWSVKIIPVRGKLYEKRIWFGAVWWRWPTIRDWSCGCVSVASVGEGKDQKDGDNGKFLRSDWRCSDANGATTWSAWDYWWRTAIVAQCSCIKRRQWWKSRKG